MPVYFDISSSYAIDDVGAKSAVIKTLDNEKMRVTNADQVGTQHEATAVAEN